MQDPDPYLLHQNISVPCAMHPERSAIIDAAHRSILNFEVFYFSDEPSKARFDTDPLEYCGILTDPVTHARFVPGSAAPHIDWDGHTFYFFSDETLAQFKAMPDSFAQPRYTMRDMHAAPPDSSAADPNAPKADAPHG